MTDNPQVPENQAEQPEETTSSERIFGKYESMDEAQKGYWNAVEKLKATEAEKAQLEAAVYQLLNERQNPMQMAQQRQAPDPWSRLSETEVPVDALQEAVRQESLKAVGQLLGPMANAWQAREFMVSKDPDFVKNEGEIMKFVNSDPQIKRTYDTLMGGRTPEEAKAAVEWASLKWKAERAPVQRVDRSAERSAAGVPSPAGTSSPDATQVLLDKLQAARETAVRTGDKEALYSIVHEIAQMQQGGRG